MIRALLQTLLGAELIWTVARVCDAVDTYGARQFFGLGAFLFVTVLACWWLGSLFALGLPTWPTPSAEGRKETR